MTPASVLIVKPSSLGDIIHTLPAVHYLKATFQDTKIFWIANTEWVPLLEKNADLKTVIPFPRSEFRGPAGILKFFRWCRGLAGLQPDLVLDFQGLLRSAWISRSAKGKAVFGLSDATEGSRFCYDRLAPVDPTQHAVRRYVTLARLAGADTSGPIQFPLPRGKAIQWFKLPQRFVVLHPFARGAGKSLSSREIFEFVHLLFPIPVVVVGQSKAQFATEPNGISLVNQTSLLELIWLLRQSTFIVSVDSGPMHVGAAITSELLSIHTWSDPVSVGPYNPDAWIWKGQRVFQVRSHRMGDPGELKEERPNIIQIANFVLDRLLR
ncbi:MAG: glycosyltransferase family 9 protein [Verrucomicrobia bacterium]|nr:glycosyltransferase family 9 protein [Verrucomicrobiota bacterium]